MYSSLQLASTASSALFLLLIPFRFSDLRAEPTKVVPGHHGRKKTAIAIVLALAQAVVLIPDLFALTGFNSTVVSTLVSLAACVALCPLLALEHTKSIAPSDLGVVYLLSSVACDTAFLSIAVTEYVTPAGIFPRGAILLVRLLLLGTECRGKKDILRDPYCKWPPEQLSGVLGRVFFWWINPILAEGNRNILTEDNLPPMDRTLLSKVRRHRALQAWDQRVKPEKWSTLPKVLVRSMLPQFLAPILPRLCVILFRYAQPVLISTAIRCIGESSPDARYSVILMAVVVYVGLAVSGAWYQRCLTRLEVMVRGAVVGLINNKSLSQQSGGYDDGRAVTLMSIDAGSVCEAATMFHGAWAQAVEVTVGMVMLARQVGWVAPVPLVIIFFCSRVSRYLAKNLQKRKKAWTEATQTRIALTTSMLASIKSLKMLGLSKHTESQVHGRRLREMAMAMKVRWLMVAYNASANALGIFSPIITFIIFALVASFWGKALDTETAFTTTAVLGLVTHPANMIMTIVPNAVGALAAFERIQEYLLLPPRQDQRLALKTAKVQPHGTMPAISLEDVTLQPMRAIAPLLTRINLSINRGSVTICAGPNGSGKTMLARSILGELPTASGTISVSSKRISWCDQSPWLPGGTLKEAVCGFNPEEDVWYQQVLRLCCLEEDLRALPNGDATVIGSRGLNLSGGQRQRVALARAVYALCDIIILDDSFSALDGNTESQIVENLLGSKGHFRKIGTTVFLITNSTTHFHLADWLVILGNGTISYQGTWNDLPQDSRKRVLKVQIGESQTSTTSALPEPQIDKKVQTQKLRVAEAVSDMRRATGDLSLYGYYLGAVGARNFLPLLACTASYSFFVTFPQYWLQKWTEAPVSQTRYYIGGYLISSSLAWAATNGSMWSTHIRIAPSSGVELHRRLLSSIIGAPLLFFSTTDIGVILNRFSHDMQLVDGNLPPAFLSFSNQVFKLLVQTVLLFTAQKLMALTLPLCMVAIYLVQKIYLRTSRQLRLLDLESQSAVYSSFLESVEGIATIRAFGWEKEVEQASIRSLDKSQQPAYVLYSLQQWLTIVLDLIVATLAIGLITLAILMRGTTTAGQIGMALNIVIAANSTLFSLVTSWTNMEISLGAIYRLKTLETDTPKEDKPHEDLVPADTWPSAGNIELDDVTVAYNLESLALQDVTMRISAGQQLAVCGRTGSGKSTLLLTLLRLVDIKSGTIKVDGVDLSLVPRSLIRQRCFITVSQDVFVLPQCSLRFNLDPTVSLPDDVVVAALRKTRLWSHFSAGEEQGSRKPRQILNGSVDTLPRISAGQAQLFAVARAILQLESLHLGPRLFKPRPEGRQIMPIILLDEATSSLDPGAETLIRSLLHEEFTEKGHTVISITHRLNGLFDNIRPGRDLVALLSNGRLEKIGSAENVLGRSALA